MFDYGDEVRVKATGVIGEVCDKEPVDGREHYIIDICPERIEDRDPDKDYLVYCFADEIEKV